MVARNLLDRAALVGGERFAEKLVKLFDEADSLALAASALVPFALVFGLIPPTWITAVPFLGGVQFTKTETQVEQGKEVINFILDVTFTRPDTSLLRRVPLTITQRP